MSPLIRGANRKQVNGNLRRLKRLLEQGA